MSDPTPSILSTSTPLRPYVVEPERLITVARARPVVLGVLGHARRWWPAYVVPLLMVLAFCSQFRVMINASESLNGTVFLVIKSQDHISDLTRGDYVAFSWQGGARIPKGMAFTKIAAGLPGDVVTAEGADKRDFFVNGNPIGHAKELARGGWMKLDPASPGTIPAGFIFVQGTHVDSLDSRYYITGLIPESALIGRAVRLW